KGFTRGRCHSKGDQRGERRNVFRTSRRRAGRPGTRRIARGKRADRFAPGGVQFSRCRSAAVAGHIATISFMRRLHPRGPYQKLGGYVHLPRLIDKARLHRKGLLDGYNYKTVGFDKHLLAFLKIDGEAFEEIANKLDDDEAILAWVQKNGEEHSPKH